MSALFDLFPFCDHLLTLIRFPNLTLCHLSSSPAPEPLANLYSPDFYRSTWVTTALDTGFATAMSIQPKFLRDIFSMLFFFYYLVYAREADEKVKYFITLSS